MTIDFNDVMDGYYPCNSCGVYVDDGSFKNRKYLCHDCSEAEAFMPSEMVNEQFVHKATLGGLGKCH